jgi:hypothetical protein
MAGSVEELGITYAGLMRLASKLECVLPKEDLEHKIAYNQLVQRTISAVLQRGFPVYWAFEILLEKRSFEFSSDEIRFANQLEAYQKQIRKSRLLRSGDSYADMNFMDYTQVAGRLGFTQALSYSYPSIGTQSAEIFQIWLQYEKGLVLTVQSWQNESKVDLAMLYFEVDFRKIRGTVYADAGTITRELELGQGTDLLDAYGNLIGRRVGRDVTEGLGACIKDLNRKGIVVNKPWYPTGKWSGSLFLFETDKMEGELDEEAENMRQCERLPVTAQVMLGYIREI